MVESVAHKVSADFIQENLTNLLTTTLPFKRSLERHYDFMLTCLEYHPSPIRQSTAYKKLGKDRKYFQDVIPELEKYGLIVRQNKFYFFIPAHFVRKLSGGVSTPFKKSLEDVSLDNKFLTFTESYNQHAIFYPYFHDYPEHLWEKLRGLGHWEAEDYAMKRFVFDPYYTYFEDVQYIVKMYRRKLEISIPAVSEKDPNNRSYKDVTLSQVGRFAQWFADKRLSKGKLKVTIKEDKPRFHETNRTYLFQEIANKLYQDGLTHIVHDDWMLDCSKNHPEWEAVQNYFMFSREGKGSDLVDEVLYLPRMFFKLFVPHQAQQLQLLQKNLDERTAEQESVNVELVKNLQLMNENLEKGNRSLENISVFLENLATKEDIELVQEHLQRLNSELEKQQIRVLHVGLDSKCQKILNKLAEGSQTRSELALFLGVSDAAPLTQLRKLLAAGLIEEEEIETGRRGRPKKEYKLVK